MRRSLPEAHSVELESLMSIDPGQDLDQMQSILKIAHRVSYNRIHPKMHFGHSGRIFIMNLDDILSEIHTLSLTELTARLRILIPSQRPLMDKFFGALSEKGH